MGVASSLLGPGRENLSPKKLLHCLPTDSSSVTRPPWLGQSLNLTSCSCSCINSIPSPRKRGKNSLKGFGFWLLGNLLLPPAGVACPHPAGPEPLMVQAPQPSQHTSSVQSRFCKGNGVTALSSLSSSVGFFLAAAVLVPPLGESHVCKC